MGGKLAAATLALLLAGCAGQVRTSFGDITSFYDRGLVRYAASGGAFPLVVHGNPFAGLSDEQAAAETARRMRLPGWFPETPFALAPVAEAPSGDYRLVLIFNPARPLGAGEICGDLRRTPLAPPGDEIRVAAAFCAGQDWVTEAKARSPAAPPDSPVFQRLLDQLAVAVFPSRNRLFDDEPDISPFAL